MITYLFTKATCVYERDYIFTMGYFIYLISTKNNKIISTKKLSLGGEHHIQNFQFDITIINNLENPYFDEESIDDLDYIAFDSEELMSYIYGTYIRTRNLDIILSR